MEPGSLNVSQRPRMMQQTLLLQQELEQLTPIPDDDLEQAANLLSGFGNHWERLEGDPVSQRDLVQLSVQRVCIDGEYVVAMTLISNGHLVLSTTQTGQPNSQLTRSHTGAGVTGFEVTSLYTDGNTSAQRTTRKPHAAVTVKRLLTRIAQERKQTQDRIEGSVGFIRWWNERAPHPYSAWSQDSLSRLATRFAG